MRDAIDLWTKGIEEKVETLTELNVNLIQLICQYLEIQTPIELTSKYPSHLNKTERLINLVQRTQSNIYVSGPTAQTYIEQSKFEECSIELEYKTYDYDPYPQLWGEFIGDVTILDLIANMGPKSKSLLSER